ARRLAGHADDVAEMDVDLAGAARVAKELDPPRAVDEVDEHELAHVASAHDAAGETPRLGRLLPVRERLDLCTNGRDLDPVREALRQAHGRRVYVSGLPRSNDSTSARGAWQRHASTISFSSSSTGI